eukprot:GHVT01001604.1.p1 GENE.GHVT01001604.1~~GHVT01001604.1.p1  ORF type:complete len:591 (+),score=173.20 GHVT01001604.1:408-2180(+)
MRRLPAVCFAMGAERARKEMVPFLLSLLPGPAQAAAGPTAAAAAQSRRILDEEILHALAQQLPQAAALLGGPASLHLLLPVAEKLATLEETVIRDQAIASLRKILISIPAGAKRQEFLRVYLLPFVHRLCADEGFASRVSGVLAVVVFFGDCAQIERAQLANLLVSLCSDDTPMVRRQATSRLGVLFRFAGEETMADVLLPCYSLLAKDDADSIRMSIVAASVDLARRPGGLASALPVLQEAVEDKSWRVRLTVATNFHKLVDAAGTPEASQHFLEPMLRLLDDNVLEIQTATIKGLGVCVQFFTPEQMAERILPKLSELADSNATAVKAAVSEVLGPVGARLGARLANRSALLPTAAKLLADDSFEVRINIALILSTLSSTVGAEGSAELLRMFQVLAQDRQWRIRHTLALEVDPIVKVLGESAEVSIRPLLLAFLTDSARAVRDAASQAILALGLQFGGGWLSALGVAAVEKIFANAAGPQEESSPSTYLQRISALHLLPGLAAQLPPPTVTARLVPILMQALKEDVPNVRFTAAHVVAAMAADGSLAPDAIEAKILPWLLTLRKDADVDVQFFATSAVAQCRAAVHT